MDYKCNIISYEDFKEYSKAFNYAYNRPDFLETLSHHSPVKHYLSVGDKKPKAILFFAEYEKKLAAPFSAPFWNIEKIKQNYSTDSVSKIVKAFTKYVSAFHKDISVILPPLFYDNEFISKTISCFLANGFTIKHIDINHYLDLESINAEEYVGSLPSNARRNLKIAEKHNLQFQKLEYSSEIEEAFHVIIENRKAKNFPLRLTFSQLQKTLLSIGGDVFAISRSGKILASAFIFNINSKTKQLIYWGDMPVEEQTKSMNLLAYQLFLYYKKTKIKFLDLGPSSEAGHPNIGLSTFKESIGSSVSIKVTLTKIQYDENICDRANINGEIPDRIR